ncbi:MAG: hypothetical protein KJ871_10950 [Alphaproteobacteria bacterium]|nr:hypothetical protein [Alphaproteobacteria bacterium]MBU2082839.1 hypothetical protein [Alphaproteobacteria bacterium]MBU2142977.1 hypothetical protein [Alphaproteobacteria bacterium]MBU2196571.1 hypothetical protein [Alphaproteobacteria bacterium]
MPSFKTEQDAGGKLLLTNIFPEAAICSVYFLVIWGLFFRFVSEGEPIDWPYHVLFALDPERQIPPNFMLHMMFRTIGGGFVQQALIAAAAKTALIVIVARGFFHTGQPFHFDSRKAMLVAYAMAIMVSLAMPVFWLSADPRPYLGKFSPNVAHNPTYILMAPFMAALWWMFTRRVLSTRPVTAGWLAAFALLSVATALAKPSFHLAFIATAGIVCVWALVNRRHGVFGLMFIGAAIALPIGLEMLAMSGVGPVQWDQSHFVVAPFVALGKHVKDPVGALISSLLFPLLIVLAVARKPGSSACFWLGWILFGFAMLVAILFGEEGRRMAHANFYWGVYGAVLLLFIEGGALLVRRWEQGLSSAIGWVCAAVLAVHAGFGLLYHVRIALGADPLA